MKRNNLLWLLVCLAVLMAGAGTAAADEVYAETSLEGASEAQFENILLAVQAINGTQIGFAEEFSFNDTVGERSEEYGYQTARNGRGVNVVGGGVAQTATTLYLALMQRDDIEYSSIYTYNESFAGDYVESGYDAILTDYRNDIDFAFNSYHEGVLGIYMWVEDERLCCFVSEQDEYYGDGVMVSQVLIELNGSNAQRRNVDLAARSIDGWVLCPGDVFSFNEIVGPRSEDFGYSAALNGRGVKVVGGGVAQVASAVYMSVKELDYIGLIEKKSYGERYSGDYVEDPEDAVLVDYNNRIDFSFVNNGTDTVAVYTYIIEDYLICEIYEYGGGYGG